MTFHHHAVESEKHAAVERARIELLAQRAQRAGGEDRAQPAEERALQRAPEIMRDELRGAFGGLQRHVAGEAVGDDNVDGTGADIVTLDKAAELDRQVATRAGSARRASPARCL